MLKTLITLSLALALSACGGGGNAGTGPLHRDPLIADKQLDLADKRSERGFDAQQTAEANRKEIALKRLDMEAAAAAAKATLDRETAALKEDTTRQVSKMRTEAGTSMAFLAAILVAACFALKVGLNHRGEEIAFRAQAQQNMAAIDGLLKQLPHLPEDIQRAVLLNLTDKALGKPTPEGSKA